ncbi:MAG TPA: asparagine synthase-related protein [Candidatus Omnitrophota bacterium]|nr:asparagine synthase-related protein [Candidatus Omnitrophota bacterium]
MNTILPIAFSLTDEQTLKNRFFTKKNVSVSFWGNYDFNLSKTTYQEQSEYLIQQYNDFGIDFILATSPDICVILHDRSKDRTIIKADGIGYYPLYYTIKNNRLYFSSDLKTLAKEINSSIAQKAVSTYLHLNYLPGSSTFFNNINKIPPSHFLTFSKKSAQLHHYGCIFKKLSNQSEAELKRSLHRRFQEIFERYKHQTVGIMISGGIDSSFLLSLASQHAKQIKTFVIGNKQHSPEQFKQCEKIAHYFKAQHHEVEISFKEYLRLFEPTFRYLNEPIFDVDLPIMNLVTSKIAKHCDIILHGFGSDEVFGGAPATFIMQYLRGKRYCKTPLPRENILVKSALFSILNRVPQELAVHNRICALNKATIKFPFLDYHIVKKGMSLPLALKLHNGTDKYLFRTLSLNELPKEIVFKRKISTGIPPLWRKAIVNNFKYLINTHGDSTSLSPHHLQSQSMLIKYIIFSLWQNEVTNPHECIDHLL